MPRRISRFAVVFASALSLSTVRAADTDLERGFTQTVRPFLATYCAACHATATPAAQFDLKPYTNLDAVVRDFGHWTLLMDKLAAGQMPPKGMKQPSADARQAVIDWVKAVRSAEARKESRGAHDRSDYPDRPGYENGRDDKEWLKHTLWYKDGNRLDYKPVKLKPLTVEPFQPKARVY